MNYLKILKINLKVIILIHAVILLLSFITVSLAHYFNLIEFVSLFIYIIALFLILKNNVAGFYLSLFSGAWYFVFLPFNLAVFLPYAESIPPLFILTNIAYFIINLGIIYPSYHLIRSSKSIKSF